MGVPVTGVITTTDVSDTYPTTDPLTGIDSWRSVADTTARNAIPNLRRRQGMAVWVQADSTLWTLNASPWAGDNTDWTQFTGGGTGTVTSITAGTGLSGGTITTSGTIAIAAGGVGPTQLASGAALANIGAGGLTSTYLASGAAATNVGTLGGDLSGTLPSPTVASIGGHAVTLGGTLATSGAHNLTLTITADTNVTLPTSGTLLSTAAAVTVAQGGTGAATLTAHAVLLGEGTSTLAFATIGTSGRVLTDQGASADPAFSSTGLKIDSHYGAITVDTPSAGAVTCNLSTSDKHNITLVNGTPTTISLSNATTGQVFRIKLIQDGTGSCTVVWFTTIKWAGGSAPTLTTAASKADVFIFECTGTNTYDGFVVGQNI